MPEDEAEPGVVWFSVGVMFSVAVAARALKVSIVRDWFFAGLRMGSQWIWIPHEHVAMDVETGKGNTHGLITPTIPD